jgi:hypothetical protein
MDRALKSLQRKAGTSTPDRNVLLHGGPMDGWYVRSNAAALRTDWGLIGGYGAKAYIKRGGPDRYGITHADWRKIT